MRVYAQWAGNPRGIPENLTCCIKEVWKNYHNYQCAKKRGYDPEGLYCKQHAKSYDTNPT